MDIAASIENAMAQLVKRIVFALGLSGIFAAISCRPSGPVVYAPPSDITGWYHHRNPQNGFEIYMPNYTQRIEYKNTASFHWDRFSIGVTRKREPKDKVIAHLLANGAKRTGEIVVGGINGTRFAGRSGNFEGTWPYEICVLEHGADVYQILWSTGSEFTALQNALCRQIVGSIKLTGIIEQERYTHQNKSHGLSISYSNEWLLTAAEIDRLVEVTPSTGITVSVYAKPETTFAEFAREQGNQVRAVSGIIPIFSKRYLGRRLQWLERETYVIERTRCLLLVVVQFREPPQPISRALADEILDSITISEE